MEKIANRDEILFDDLIKMLKERENEVDKGRQITILLAVLNSVIAPQMPMQQFAPMLSLQLLESCCNKLQQGQRASYLRKVIEQLDLAAKALDAFTQQAAQAPLQETTK